MKLLTDITYKTIADQDLKLDLYLPDTDTADLLIYFHGGGMEAGDKADNKKLYENLVSRGKAVISANYRMYPTAAFPEFIIDAASVIAWAKQHLAEYITPGKFFIGGSSAGAYLTAMLAYAPNYLGEHDIRTTDIAGYIINSAQMTTHFNVLREKGIDNRKIVVDEAAPIYFIGPDMSFPNVLILAADADMPCRLEQNQMFIKSLEMFGCPKEKVKFLLMEGFNHCGYDQLELFFDIVYNYMQEA